MPVQRECCSAPLLLSRLSSRSARRGWHATFTPSLRISQGTPPCRFAPKVSARACSREGRLGSSKGGKKDSSTISQCSMATRASWFPLQMTTKDISNPSRLSKHTCVVHRPTLPQLERQVSLTILRRESLHFRDAMHNGFRRRIYSDRLCKCSRKRGSSFAWRGVRCQCLGLTRREYIAEAFGFRVR